MVTTLLSHNNDKHLVLTYINTEQTEYAKLQKTASILPVALHCNTTSEMEDMGRRKKRDKARFTKILQVYQQ